MSLIFDDKTFRHYSAKHSRWEIEGGIYQLYIGPNVSDIEFVEEIYVEPCDFNPHELDAYYPSYYDGQIENSTIDDLSILLGYQAPIEKESNKIIEANSTIMDLKQCQSGLARFVSRRIEKQIIKSEKKKKPDLNLLFMYNMPFRAMSKMTNGQIDQAMIQEILIICNGEFFKGFVGLIKSYRQNKKRTKEMQRRLE